MSDPSRKILVTGGAGFIGSHVADAYLARGNQVWVLDNLSSGKRENVPDGAEFVEMDIRDREVLDLFRNVRFDLVNHHAAQIDVRVSVSDPPYDAEVNLLGLLNLLEGARGVGTERFLFISSGGVVYGESEKRPTPEEHAKNPLSPYGVTKLTGELYLNYYRHVHGLTYAALRYSNVFGPRQDPHGEAGVVAIFSSRLQAEEDLTIFGDGEQTRDYVFVHDVVAANMLLSDLDLGSAGPSLDAVAFNVGTAVETSVNQLAGILMKVSGKVSPIEYLPARSGELKHSALDPTKLVDLGWAPGQSLEEGLQATYDYLEKERETA